MNPWLLVLATSIAVAFGFTAPVASFELNFGGSAEVQASSNTGESSSTSTHGANTGLSFALSGNTRPGDGIATPASTSGSMAASLIAAADADARIQAVIRLVESSEWDDASFDGMASVAGSTAFDVDAWLTSETEAEFATALESNWMEVQDLQAAIAANGAFSAWLDTGDVKTENVVAVGQTADGSLAVFTSGS